MKETVITRSGPRGFRQLLTAFAAILVPLVFVETVEPPAWLGNIVIGISAVVGISAFVWEALRRSRLLTRLRGAGYRGYGTVVELRDEGGGSSQSQTLVRIEMDVEGEGESFRAVHRARVSPVHMPKIQPGQTFPVLWDRDDRRLFVIDLKL